MKNKILSAILMMAITSTTVLTGCGKSEPVVEQETESVSQAAASVDEDTESSNTAASMDSEEDSNATVSPDAARYDEMTYYEKAAYMTDYLYSQNKENVSFSMLSLDMALALANAGADIETKDALDGYLGKGNSTQWAKTYMDYIQNYAYVDDNSQGDLDPSSLDTDTLRNVVKNMAVTYVNDVLGGLNASDGHLMTDDELRASLDIELKDMDKTALLEQYNKMAGEIEVEVNGQSNVAQSKPVTVELANGIWVDDDFTLLDDYKNTAETSFRASVNSVDMTDATNRAGVITAINSYVDEKTHGLIKEIVNENSVDETTAAVLVNTLYFKGAWAEQWSKSNGKFYISDGMGGSKAVDCEMIGQEVSAYLENDYATGFVANYANGYKFIGILPKEEGDFTIQSLDIKSLLGSENPSGTVRATMPVIKTETMNECIVNGLKTLGLAVPFDEMGANFKKMGQCSDDENIYISDIIQKTTVDINEFGTEASAATAVIMNKTTAMTPDEEDIKTVVLNRPYAYIIYDAVNDQILFMGKVVDVQ